MDNLKNDQTAEAATSKKDDGHKKKTETIESRHARAANEDVVQNTKPSATTAANDNHPNTTSPD